jgi:hypothetical protein
MSNQPSSSRFVVLFGVDPANDRPAERLALMRRFLDSGLGAGIDVLEQAFFPNYARVGFVLLVEAPSRQIVVAALEPCVGVFTTTVEAPVSLTFDPATPASTLGVFGVSTPHDDPSAPGPGAPQGSGAVSVRLHAELPEGGEVSSLTLVDAPTFGAAHAFGRSEVGSAVTETARIQPMGDYIAHVRTLASTDAAPRVPTTTASDAIAVAAAEPSGAFTVSPLDSALILLSSNDLAPFGATMPLRVAQRGSAISLSGRTYVWQKLRGPLDIVVDWSNANNLFIHSAALWQGDFNWASPIAVIPGAPGLAYTVGTRSDNRGVQVASDLGTWLHDLMTTSTYDAPWPEDTYTGGQLAAYQFILSKLPGQTPPNRGTIRESEEIEVIAYPGGTAFTQDEFDDVKNHLLVEIGHFVTVDQWFGPNGITNAISSQISILSAGDLTEAAAMMSIPPPTPVTMSLDSIMGIISSFVSAIPEVGSVFSAVVTTSYDVVQAVLPREAKQPIQATVGAIADQLNEYLIQLVASAAVQHRTLSTDWGRLNEFSSGVATGRISAEAFYGAGGPGALPGGSTGAESTASSRSAETGPPPLPPDYLHAAKNAWLTYAYQQLFATQHSVHCQLSLTDQPPTNPWDPSTGNFHYTWSLPCAYTDSKGNTHENGYLVFDCSTDAPSQVMAQLFAPGSPLAVNPVEFFVGFNGWPQVAGHYAQPYQNISDTIPWPPIGRIGLDPWGALPG